MIQVHFFLQKYPQLRSKGLDFFVFDMIIWLYIPKKGVNIHEKLAQVYVIFPIMRFGDVKPSKSSGKAVSP